MTTDMLYQRCSRQHEAYDVIVAGSGPAGIRTSTRNT